MQNVIHLKTSSTFEQFLNDFNHSCLFNQKEATPTSVECQKIARFTRNNLVAKGHFLPPVLQNIITNLDEQFLNCISNQTLSLLISLDLMTDFEAMTRSYLTKYVTNLSKPTQHIMDTMDAWITNRFKEFFASKPKMSDDIVQESVRVSQINSADSTASDLEPPVDMAIASNVVVKTETVQVTPVRTMLIHHPVDVQISAIDATTPKTKARSRKVAKQGDANVDSTAANSTPKSEEKDKKFLCEVEGCNRRFARRDGLRQHEAIHTDTKPFICSVADCGQAFSRDVYRRKHEKAKHGVISPAVPPAVKPKRAKKVSTGKGDVPPLSDSQLEPQNWQLSSFLPQAVKLKASKLNPVLAIKMETDEVTVKQEANPVYDNPAQVNPISIYPVANPVAPNPAVPDSIVIKAINVSKMQMAIKKEMNQIKIKNTKPRGEFPCDVCGKVLTSSSNVRRHKLTHLPKEEKPKSERPKKRSLDKSLAVDVTGDHQLPPDATNVITVNIESSMAMDTEPQPISSTISSQDIAFH